MTTFITPIPPSFGGAPLSATLLTIGPDFVAVALGGLCAVAVLLSIAWRRRPRRVPRRVAILRQATPRASAPCAMGLPAAANGDSR